MTVSVGDTRGRVRSVNIGPKKGGAKRPVEEARTRSEWGIVGDGHAGPGHKQVSLLSWERALEMRARGAVIESGSFGENITAEGIELKAMLVGDRVRVGETVVLEVTQRGKTCPSPCAIYYRAGCCIMPEEGVFCRVLCDGTVRPGDRIERVQKQK